MWILDPWHYVLDSCFSPENAAFKAMRKSDLPLCKCSTVSESSPGWIGKRSEAVATVLTFSENVTWQENFGSGNWKGIWVSSSLQFPLKVQMPSLPMKINSVLLFSFKYSKIGQKLVPKLLKRKLQTIKSIRKITSGILKMRYPEAYYLTDLLPKSRTLF